MTLEFNYTGAADLSLALQARVAELADRVQHFRKNGPEVIAEEAIAELRRVAAMRRQIRKTAYGLT